MSAATNPMARGLAMKAPDELLGQVGAHAARGQDQTACISTPEVDPGLLLAFRHGRLDPVETEKIRAHLVECTHCRRFVGDLRPATRKELRHWQGKPRTHPMQWMALAALLIAGVAAVLLRPGVEPPPEYTAEAVLGGVKLNKSADEPAKDTFFLPESRISWVLRPATHLDAPPEARAYVVTDGRLRPLPDGALTGVDGGTWVLKTAAKTAFERDYGVRTLVIAVAFDAEALKALDGSRWERDRDSKAVKYYSRSVRYRAKMEGLE